MANPGFDFDIVTNIAHIETLKADLLSGVAELFQSMSQHQAPLQDKKEALAHIVMSAYLLSGRLGLSVEEIDGIIQSRLKAGLLSEDAAQKERASLYKHLSNR